MDIGGIGAMGAAAPMGSAACCAPAGAGGANGSVGGPGQPCIDGLTPQMQALVDLMGGFTSAQILLALMASGGGKKDDEENPMAMLLGMALGSQLQQMTQDLANLFATDPALGSSGGGCAVGTQLNVLA